ncbi:MAG: hypothetical protein WA061_03900 [Microgenomates group bacterium]
MDTQTITLPKTQTLIYYYALVSVSFLIPLFVTGPQLLTGAIVNAFLFLSVYSFNKKQILPIIVLPSIGAVLNGVLFGTFTPFLLYFMPFIWIGNYILTTVFASMIKKNSFISSLFISSFSKSALLFLIAYLYIGGHLVPPIFLKAMGVFQLVTALVGGVLALAINKLIKKNYDRP